MSANGRETARRLISSGRTGRAASRPAAAAAAAACDRLSRELSWWFGADGCHALVTRALAQAKARHPALGEIQLRSGAQPCIDGLEKAIKSYGDAATAEAFEVMIGLLVELLERLIGDDIALKLMDQSISNNVREEA